MKILWTLCLALACASAMAAGTFSTPPTTAPANARGMADAQKAIDAKDWPKAIGLLTQAVKDEPRNADAHNLLAYSLRKQAKPDLAGAFEHYNTALEINPQHKGAHEYIGEAYLMDNKPEEAQKHLAALEKICGKSCEEYEDLAKAIADYQSKKIQ